MRNRIFHGLTILTLVLGGLLVTSNLCQAAEFKADFREEKNYGGVLKLTTGKLFVKGNTKSRQEMVESGKKSIIIARIDKGVIWMIDPATKTYLEMKNTLQDRPELNKEIDKMAVKQNLGTAKVNGYLCDVTKYIYKDTKLGVFTMWVARKLKYWVKMEMVSNYGKMTRELKNIKEGRQPDSLFEIPAGYTKQTIPSYPGYPMVR